MNSTPDTPTSLAIKGQIVSAAKRIAHGLTIEATESLSNAVDIKGEVPVALYNLGGWTEASLRFEVSMDGDNFFPVWMDGETLYTVPFGDSRYVPLESRYLLGARYIRVVSYDSTGDAAVPQGVAADLLLVTAP